MLRCELYDNPGPEMYCDVCHLYLCRACVDEHLIDESKEHRVVPFRKRGSTITCAKHPLKICEPHCEQSDGPTCSFRVSSVEHEQHKRIVILKHFENKKDAMKEDSQELEKQCNPPTKRLHQRYHFKKGT